MKFSRNEQEGRKKRKNKTEKNKPKKRRSIRLSSPLSITSDEVKEEEEDSRIELGLASIFAWKLVRPPSRQIGR